MLMKYFFLSVQTFYKIVINLREPSILLPKSSAASFSTEDCLSAAIKHLALIFSNTETDAGPQYISTGFRFEAKLHNLQLSRQVVTSQLL